MAERVGEDEKISNSKPTSSQKGVTNVTNVYIAPTNHPEPAPTEDWTWDLCCLGKVKVSNLVGCFFFLLSIALGIVVGIMFQGTWCDDRNYSLYDRTCSNSSGSNQTAPPSASNQTSCGSHQTLSPPAAVPTGSKCLSPDNFPSMIAKVYSSSYIFNSAEGQKLGKSPLDFLSKELSNFTTASRVFATRELLPRTTVAADFHKACDNVPNVLVIIKSGQYIAGGYTEVPFDSRLLDLNNLEPTFKANPKGTSIIFSGNRRQVYPLIRRKHALHCYQGDGPGFGWYGLHLSDDYTQASNRDWLYRYDSSYNNVDDVVPGFLFGSHLFTVDEYEVYKLE